MFLSEYEVGGMKSQEEVCYSTIRGNCKNGAKIENLIKNGLLELGYGSKRLFCAC